MDKSGWNSLCLMPLLCALVSGQKGEVGFVCYWGVASVPPLSVSPSLYVSCQDITLMNAIPSYFVANETREKC
jgi:hypothetical protein